MTHHLRFLAFIGLQCGLAGSALSQEHRNVHYYTGGGSIRWDLLTHLVLFDKSAIDADGAFVPPSAAEVANIVRLRREAALHGKTLIYGLAGGFSSYKPMLANAAKRAAYIEGVADMVDDCELAGVDFDIEYPETAADFALMDAFYTAVRARLGPRPLVTAAVAHWQVQMNASTINNSLDWVQTMGYYFRSASQSASDLQRYADAGATRAKLSLGVPFAGKSQNSPTIPWDVPYSSLAGKVSPFDPAVNSVFHVDGDFQFVGVNFQKEKLRVAADGGGGTMVWHHTTDVTDSQRSLAVSLHEEAARYIAPIDGFELPVGTPANTLYQSGSAPIQGTHVRVNGWSGAEVAFNFNGSLYGQSRVRSKDAATGFAFPSGASIRLDYKVIDVAANVHFYLRLRDADGNYIQAPSYNALATTGWKRLTFARSAFSSNAAFNENDIRSYELFGQYGASGSAFSSRVVLDNLVMIAPHAALRPVPDADADGFSDGLEQHLGTSPTDPLVKPDAAFSGIHAWWRMDESADPVCSDAVRDVHGMGFGGISRVTGKSGMALLLNGVDGKVLMPPAASLAGSGPFSLSAWIKTTDTDGGVILQQRDSTPNGYQGEYQLAVTPQGRISFFVYNGGFQFDLASTATVHDGQWHHVAAVRDGANGRIFIDGVLVAQALGTAPKSLEPLAVCVGADSRDNMAFLNATVDDIRIYRRALGEQELGVVAAYAPARLADQSIAHDDRVPAGGTIATLSVSGAATGTSTRYRIVAGDPTGQFLLDPATGALSLSRPPDALASASRVLTVEAVTAGVSSSRSLANITLSQTLFSKQANADALSQDSSWVDRVAPGPDDVALWNRTLPAATQVPLGADRSWHGIRIADPGGSVTIPAGNSLTLGSGGIDLSLATRDLAILSGLTTGASQSWRAAAGRTLLRSGGNTAFNAGTTTTLDGPGVFEFGGTQALSGAGSLVVNGGTLFNNLQGGSSVTRSGATTLNSGTIKILTTVNLLGSGPLNLNGGTVGSGNANARTVGNPVVIGGNPAFGGSGLGSGLLTFTGNADLGGGIRTLVSNLSGGAGAGFSGVLSNGGIVKEGGGILTLSGSNNYTGPTRVNQGELRVTGSLGPTAVTVGQGAVLSGTGSLGGSLTIGQGGIHSLELATSPAAQSPRVIAGPLHLESGNVLRLSAPAPPGRGCYLLAIAGGGIHGVPGTVVLPNGVDAVVAVNGNRLELTVGGDYVAWISGFTFASGANTGATGDPDGDGLGNFHEYAFGLAPNSGASTAAVLTPPRPPTGSFRYTRRSRALSQLDYSCEWSTSPAGPWAGFTPVSESIESASPLETVTVVLPPALLANRSLFIRMKASQ